MTTAFEKFCEKQKKEGFVIYPGDRHHAAYEAWNAALERAAEICKQQYETGFAGRPLMPCFDTPDECADAILEEVEK